MLSGAAVWALSGGWLPFWEAQREINEAPVSDDPSPVLFAVRPGTSAAAVAEDLRKAGLIRSPARFRFLAESANLDTKLRAGSYELRRTMSAREILDALVSGQARRADLVTIPEGWRAEEIALLLEASGIVSADAFLKAVAGGATSQPLPVGASSFEGYLFPDSYEFPASALPGEVLSRFLEQFERRVDQTIRARALERGLSLQQLVTLASIIEREAVDPGERHRIAAVFYNRLARGMWLEADPTVQYALIPFGSVQVPTGFWKRTLERGDLTLASPYNTYRYPGLPPGPICSPGLRSLEAATDPEEGPWLYFVARGDGSHLFAATLDEHVRNVTQVGSRVSS